MGTTTFRSGLSEHAGVKLATRAPSLRVVADSPDAVAGESPIHSGAIGDGDEVLGGVQGKDGSEDAGRSRRALPVAGEVVVVQPTLSKWLRDAGSLRAVKRRGHDEKAKTEGRRPDDWTAEEKLEPVLEAKRLSGSELGEFLRRRGLHEEQLRQWQDTSDAAALESLRARKATGKSAEAKRVKELERELRRKDKALAEAAALLVLRKKAEALWRDQDASMEPKTDDESST
jgi:transposase